MTDAPPPSTPPAPRQHLAAALEWSQDGALRSSVYDDIYFQPGEGVEEARAVFLRGCDLPDAWSDASQFVVGELGFGSGLNILALIDLWRQTRRARQRLSVFTVEAHPLGATDAARALSGLTDLGALPARLIGDWPRQARGVHRIEWADLGVTIDIAVGDVADALRGWSGQADAWFLDGFAPSKNPQMWSEAVLDLVARRSAPGARVATFTVAGAVRRGLAAAGFAVDKKPGHGRKRERLEARLPGARPALANPDHVIIVGAGIAGAALARAAAAQGLAVTVIAAKPGASANPAALVTPAFDADERAAGRLYAQAFARATDLYRRSAADAIIAEGVLQLERTARDAGRFDRLAAGTLYEPGALVRLDAAAVAARLGEPATVGALYLRDALVIDPEALVETWLAGAVIVRGDVAAVERAEGGWRLLDAGGACLASGDWVVLAAGPALRALAGAPLAIVRGQCTWADIAAAGPAAAWGGYAAPTRSGVLFGATHDRNDEGVDVRPRDDLANLRDLAKGRPRLAHAVGPLPAASRASLRATTRDRLPIAAALPDRPGLFVLGGLGGRGFTTAPVLAEQIIAEIVQGPRPLPMDLAAAVAWGRASR